MPKVRRAQDLTEAEIDGLFRIYEATYVRLGIGTDKNTWRLYQLEPRYHGRAERLILMNGTTDFDAYVFFTESLPVSSNNWRKMLSYAALPSGNLAGSKSLESLIGYLTSQFPENFFSEVGINYATVLQILQNSGFCFCEDSDLVKKLMREFIGSDIGTLSDGVLRIRRQTRLAPSYEAYLMTYSHPAEGRAPQNEVGGAQKFLPKPR